MKRILMQLNQIWCCKNFKHVSWQCFGKRAFLKKSEHWSVRLEMDGCILSPKILDKILDSSIFDLIVTNCEITSPRYMWRYECF